MTALVPALHPFTSILEVLEVALEVALVLVVAYLVWRTMR